MRNPLKVCLLQWLALFFGIFAFNAAATTYYVDINSPNPTPPYTSWSTASTDIQSAVNQTANGDLVLVNPGVYQSGGYMAPDGGLSAVVVSNSVTLQSVDGASNTFINGSGTMRGIYLQNASMLIGFTITNGMSGTNSGGGIYCPDSNEIISNSIITGNLSDGQYFQIIAPVPHNGGGGVCSGTLYNCLIISNSAPYGTGGGGMFSVMTNCTLIGNTGLYGGGAAGGILANCTVVGNTATAYGGGIDNYFFNDSQAMENCIIYHNIAPSGANCYGSTYNNCCTIPLPGGTGDITNAPLFVNEAAGDFHLQSISPCVNAGNNGYVITTNDFDGNPRIVDGVVDIGAYEYQGLLPLFVSIEPSATNVAADYPLQLQAFVGNGSALSEYWDFGDGSTATNEFSVSHSWSTPGVYTVTFTATIISTNTYDATNVVTNAVATLTINVSAQSCYVNVNGTNPVAPYSSWATAATNIQDAVNAMVYYGGNIFVTNGIYQSGGYTAPDGTLSAVVSSNTVNLQSVNGPLTTFIEGSNSMRCVYLGSASALMGFTITNGSTGNNGGGITCQSTSCVVSNCIITGNSAANGGGVYQGSILNSTILGNRSTYGGGAYQGTLMNCTVLRNWAEFGGGAANATIYQSLVISNAAATPIYISNNGEEGGGVYDCSVYNSAIADNIADNQGGGAYGGTLQNCTITGNTVPAYITGAVGAGTYGLTLVNCIVYFNNAPGAPYDETNVVSGSVNYCCVLPSTGGTGNITKDPLLASISHISYGSPCRGAGDYYYTTGADIDGNAWADPPSIGCSEPAPGNYFGNMTVNVSAPSTNEAPGFPVMFQANITGLVYSNTWSFSDGTLVTNEPYVTHTWPSNGIYTVTLTGYNDTYTNGQSNSLTIFVATPTVYYVNEGNLFPVAPYSSWDTAAYTIQDALNVAPVGSLILVTNGPSMLSTNVVTSYEFNGTNAGNGTYYCAAMTRPVTLESVNGPAVTRIIGGYQKSGACVYLTNGAVLSGFTLTNFTYESAGAIYATSTNVIITNCVIKNCAGVGVNSGTLYNCLLESNYLGAQLSTLNQCTLYRNIGGASQCTLSQCTLFGNSGGAEGNSVLNNCFITSNSTATYGGGAYGGTLNNCIIVSNTAAYGGGGYGSSASPLVLNNCIISNNTAAYGGGVYNSAPYNPNFTNCILNNCLVVSNFASSYGGGAMAAQINNSAISNNLVSSSSDGGGGVEGGQVNNSILMNNFAENGGGADGSFAACTLNNCLLANNVATNAGGGANRSTLNGCTILNNTSEFGAGGGVSSSTLSGCLIVSNSALAFTGAFRSFGGGAYNSELTNCVLAYNIGMTNGGGAYTSTLVNCTVVYNSAGLGGGILNCTANNCILYYNTGGDYSATIARYPLNYCCTALLPTNGLRNITSAPLFVNAAAGNFQLQPNSPCINSGNNAYISAATDLAGNPRIVGGTVDIGAYEYQTPTSVISYAYLQQYGLPTDGSVDLADLDGSGFNVYQDWAAGLNPTNSVSILAMVTPTVATNNVAGIKVTWQSVSGILYNLQRSTNLSSPFVTVQSNITGQSSTTSYTDTTATGNVPYFYRVSVTAP